jgi:hypothetical protein
VLSRQAGWTFMRSLVLLARLSITQRGADWSPITSLYLLVLMVLRSTYRLMRGGRVTGKSIV